MKKFALTVAAICLFMPVVSCSSKDDAQETASPSASTAVAIEPAVAPSTEPAPKTEPASDVNNTIIANATGEYYVTPDVAYISVGMQSTGSSAEQVQRQNDEAMVKILADIKKEGIADEDIKTSQYSVQPEYDYSSSRRIIKGYVATNTATVTVNDIGKVGTVLEAANKAGANNIGSVSFSIKDRDGAYDMALAEAIKTARKRANTMAEASGVSLGGLVQVSQSDYSSQYVYRAYEEDYAASESVSYDAGISIGEMKITATAQVVFEIK